MSDHRGIAYVQQFFPGTGATYDRIVNLCTLGCDRWWKRQILAKIPAGATRIMDQACGTGILTFKIAQRFPRARIFGVDVTEEYLAIAQEKARRLQVKNVEFILGRAEDVLLEEGFDCLTSSYLAKYAELDLLIPAARAMLRPGGIVIMHDFTYPRWPLAPLWELYFRLLQTLGARQYPQWKRVFDDLPGLMRETAWVRELVSSLEENRFGDIAVKNLTCGTAAIITAKR